MSVESVGLALPTIFSVSGSPVTSTGTLEGELVTQAPNTVFAGPESGGSDAPTFRALGASDLPLATTVSSGAVTVGSGLSVSGGVLSANTPNVATTSALGVVSVGDGLSISGAGVLSADPPAIATSSTLGVVSVGSGLSVSGAGVLTINAPAVATTSSLGVVSVGAGLSISGAGVLSASTSYSVGVPLISAFTKVNTSNCTITEVSGSSITVTSPGASGINLFVMYKAAPTPPYRLAAFVSIAASSVNYLGGGIGFYDVSTGKVTEVFFCWNLSNTCNIQVTKFNSTSSVNSTAVTWAWSLDSAGFWLGLRDDGTNVYYEFSADGAHFITVYQEVKSSGFLSSYANVAFITNPNTAGSTRSVANTLFIWDANGLSRTPSIV